MTVPRAPVPRPPAPRALFAAPAAGRALAPGREGVVELVLSRGAYARLGADWLMLAGPELPFGPLSLVVDALDPSGLVPGWPVRTLAGRLELGPCRVSLARMRARGTAPVDRGATGDAGAVAAAMAAVIDALPSPPSYLSGGVEALAQRRTAAAVRALAGLGEGLTPAGDDVLAGFAAASVARGIAVRSDPVADGGPGALSALAARRASPLGLAYLRCAERGELPDPGARLLVAISRGSAPDALSALPGLRAWGASSGIALAWGMAAALRSSANAASTAAACPSTSVRR